MAVRRARDEDLDREHSAQRASSTTTDLARPETEHRSASAIAGPLRLPAYPLDRRAAHIQCGGDGLVGPARAVRALVGLEQDTGVQQFTGASTPRRQPTAERRPFALG
jgi:hypothetical protein